MNQKVCIISLRFTPTCLSKLPAWGELFHALGYEVEYVLDPKYKKFEEFANNDAAVAATDPGWSTSRRYEHALFFHPVPTNHIHARKLSNTGCKIWYFYDEPWESLGTYLLTESLFDVLKLLAAHQLSIRILRSSHGVIDADGLLQENRIYFSFIGNLAKVHGFGEFIRFVRYAVRRKLDIRFLIDDPPSFGPCLLAGGLWASFRLLVHKSSWFQRGVPRRILVNGESPSAGIENTCRRVQGVLRQSRPKRRVQSDRAQKNNAPWPRLTQRAAVTAAVEILG